MLNFSQKRKKYQEIEPDEIFIDSQNIPQFNTQQFEGKIVKPISKKTIYSLGIFFAIIGLVFIYRFGVLQISKGEAYFARSENNVLKKTPIFSNRGVIYDRNGKELAWNKSEDGYEYLRRAYTSLSGMGHLIGHLSYPAKDKSGFYWRNDFVGKEGIEKQYDQKLQGAIGWRLIEVDAALKIHSENLLNPPKSGDNLALTVDARISDKFYEFMSNFARNYSFKGGSGIIMDANNGEIVAITSFPEFSSQVMSEGKNVDTINSYLNDKRMIFLNRAVSGLYSPGSIVKPFVALGALNESIIDPNKKILANGYISVPNPYDKNKPSIFRDWKVHGWIDMRQAIAHSSDVYFYEIGGGFEEQKGLGITNIEKYVRLFGIGEMTGINLPAEVEGVIPNPEWKQIHFNGDPWRIGDTYNTAIGQYGFQVTPIQMARATAALANKGKLVKPHLIKTESASLDIFSEISIPESYYKIIHEGMRKAVTDGTASRINIPEVEVAAKSGTAQVGVNKQFVNSWIIGFFPYKEPRYAFALVMEKGPKDNSVGSAQIIRELLEWMAYNTPEYFQN